MSSTPGIMITAKGKVSIGINAANLIQETDGVRLPLCMSIVHKDKMIEEKGKQRRKSSKTKHELFREQFSQTVHNEVKFGTFLVDSWFGNTKNMEMAIRVLAQGIYLIEGTLKSDNKIQVKKNANITSETCKYFKFHIGKLIEDSYFNAVDEKIKLFPKDGTYFINTKIYTFSYLKYQDIICYCKSTQGNPIIINKNPAQLAISLIH